MNDWSKYRNGIIVISVEQYPILMIIYELSKIENNVYFCTYLTLQADVLGPRH